MDLATVKSLLGITSSEYDSRITALLPVIKDWVKGYCRNVFKSSFRKVECTDLAFVASTKKITGSLLTTIGLVTSNEVIIEGPLNSGNYTIASVQTDGIIVNETIFDETYLGTGKVTKIEYPPATSLCISKLIWYEIQNPESVKQRSLGDESKTYYDGYPVALLQGLQRRVEFA